MTRPAPSTELGLPPVERRALIACAELALAVERVPGAPLRIQELGLRARVALAELAGELEVRRQLLALIHTEEPS